MEKQSINQPEAIQSYYENQGIYLQDILIDRKRFLIITKKSFKLKHEDGFRTSVTDKIKKRKHVIYCGKKTGEIPMDAELTSNEMTIPLMARRDISQQLEEIPIKEKNNIGYLYVRAIRIIFKAFFREGNDSPLEAAILDNRLIKPTNAITGIVQGNLAYKKFVFTVCPKYSVSLLDQHFDKAFTLLQD